VFCGEVTVSPPRSLDRSYATFILMPHDYVAAQTSLSCAVCHSADTSSGFQVGTAGRQGLTTLLAERHARHLAGRAQTLQDARKPVHTDPSTI
jgi:hypothetical protein